MFQAMLSYELLLAFTVLFFTQNVSNLREMCEKQPFKDVLVVSGEGRSLTLESDVDDGVILGLGVFVNLHEFFCDKTILRVCVDAGLHKVLVRYTKHVLIVDTVDECLSKMSVVEERLEWEIIFSLNDWKNSPSSVDTGCGGCRGTCSEMICCSGRCRGSLI